MRVANWRESLKDSMWTHGAATSAVYKDIQIPASFKIRGYLSKLKLVQLRQTELL